MRCDATMRRRCNDDATMRRRDDASVLLYFCFVRYGVMCGCQWWMKPMWGGATFTAPNSPQSEPRIPICRLPPTYQSFLKFTQPKPSDWSHALPMANHSPLDGMDFACICVL